jgi:probable HAF family extracellular repeat protein
VNDAGVYHAFVWDRTSGMRDLGRLGSLVTNYSEARAINGPGEIVGVALNIGNTAFYWLPGPMPEMTPLVGLGFATGVNDTGLIAGYFLDSVYTAYVRQLDGGITPMPHLGTQGRNQSYGNAINASGQVVGVAQTDHSIARAFLWDRVAGVMDLGTMKPTDDSTSVAIGINDLGQVVGYADTDAGIVVHAFRWSSAAGMEDLGSLGTASADRSEAWGINTAGQVVGRTGTSAGLHGFVWTEAGGMVDLNTVLAPGTTQILVIAQSINDHGEIVGTSHDFRALLLTPVTGP